MAPSTTAKNLSIGDIARETGVSADTLRYYEKMGLIAPLARTQAGYRMYGAEAVRIIRFIRGAKALSFTLEEIRQLLVLDASDKTTCADMLARTQKKMHEAEQKIRELKAIKKLLDGLVKTCPGDGASLKHCPIMDHIKTGGRTPRQKKTSAATVAVLAAMMFTNPTPANAKPVSYVGGTMVMQENDETGYTATVDYTITPRVSIGAYAKRERGEDDRENYTTAGPQVNLLLKRWNFDEAQGNIFSTTGAGVTTLDGHSQFAAWTSILADYETRRIFTSYEARFITAGDIDTAFSHRARVGVSPYKGGYDEINPWLMLQVDHHPTKEDDLVVTPLVRAFYGTNLIEAGYSSNHNIMFNWIKQF